MEVLAATSGLPLSITSRRYTDEAFEMRCQMALIVEARKQSPFKPKGAFNIRDFARVTRSCV
jgi:hypothetical protein